MVQEAVSRAELCLSCSLLLGLCFAADGAGAVGPLPAFPPQQASREPDFEDLEWGSGSTLLHLTDGFHADSSFLKKTQSTPVNCTQSFWLPPSSDVCWDDLAGPEEFARSRLLVLQNRAALQALSTSSGMEDGGSAYEHQAREEVQGILSDHQSMVETMQTMERVFVTLEEKRKEGKEQEALTSLKQHLSTTRDNIIGRERVANILEDHFSNLEKTLLNIHLRLSKLKQWK
ncbi:uncharacterized protein si:ch211-57n23.1 [Antennarius striatus]|uniref:uncharacterized protein si:ch211-57n23.1 n=1 Tax=Antennarius striatus TaxID=241820 RepID=UPI0035B2B9CE